MNPTTLKTLSRLVLAAFACCPTSHAATILAEDVSVLLNTDCLDRWTDECDAVTSELVSTDAHVPTEASE